MDIEGEENGGNSDGGDYVNKQRAGSWNYPIRLSGKGGVSVVVTYF